MKIIGKIVLFATILLFGYGVMAQNIKDEYDSFKRQAKQQFDEFNREAHKQYETFRDSANKEYAEFMKQPWSLFDVEMPMPAPDFSPMPPIICPDDERDKIWDDNPIPFDEIILDTLPENPQPQPVSPVVVPNIPEDDLNTITMLFYGTRLQLSVVQDLPVLKLQGVDEENITDGWNSLSSGQYNGLLNECLTIRSQYQLNDWAYLQFLDSLSCIVAGQAGNEAILMMAWLYCQSGYKMRLAYQGEKISMLYSSKDIIYNVSYFILDNERYYGYKNVDDDRSYIFNHEFPGEQAMSLKMSYLPDFMMEKSKNRTLSSDAHPEIKVSSFVNLNLINFYNHYPWCALNGNDSTLWAFYANTSICEEPKADLYSQLRKFINVNDTLQSAEKLLNFVQTAFEYEYDDTVWGGERVFFPEETLYYPYCDCEDRAILYSRLVRDLLGLNAVLLYYPGHLATAVKFTGKTPTGDYLDLPDGKYYISDPTYIGASIGMTMPIYKDVIPSVVRLN